MHEERLGGRIRLPHRKATVVGATIGAAIVIAAWAVVAISPIGLGIVLGVAMVIGGWAGRQYGRHRELSKAPREAVRRKRSIRILRITRTLRRRRLRHRSTDPRRAFMNAARVRRPA